MTTRSVSSYLNKLDDKPNSYKMNDNHLNRVLKSKNRYYQIYDELKNDESVSTKLEKEKENNGNDINQEIKCLIGKLLKAKDKLTENLKSSKFSNAHLPTQNSQDDSTHALAHNSKSLQNNKSMHLDPHKLSISQSRLNKNPTIQPFRGSFRVIPS